MDVKEILRLAAIFTDQKDLLEDEYFLLQTPPEYQSSDERQERIKAFLDCLNLVYSEVITEYLPQVTVEDAEFCEGVYPLQSFSKVVTNVLEVRNKFGKKLRFKLLSNFILCDVKLATVKYHFVPSSLTLNSKISLNGEKIPARVFAYGVAMEYYFLQTQSTEALIWENRFRNSLFNLLTFKRNVFLPTRRWI
jgi:hypothetical protein